jgi:hypothetical protein
MEFADNDSDTDRIPGTTSLCGLTIAGVENGLTTAKSGERMRRIPLHFQLHTTVSHIHIPEKGSDKSLFNISLG